MPSRPSGPSHPPHPSHPSSSSHPSRPNRLARFIRLLGGVPGLRAVLLHPVVARPGYWLVTALGLLWGGILSLGRIDRRHGLFVCRRMPRWSFGRGGTMVGAAYWTNNRLSDSVLRHEAVHKQQWQRYGLVFPLLYLAAGRNPFRNRFEIEAGLELGGYAPRRSADPAQ